MSPHSPIRRSFVVAMIATLGALAPACESGAVSDPEVKACAELASVGVVCPGRDAGPDDAPAPESLCKTDRSCSSDEECDDVADSSCNTNTGKCQLLQCAPATGECSSDEHCREGRRCEADVCVYDPTPCCYSMSGGVCREGAWEGGSGDWMVDCQDEGGEVLSACPEEGKLGVCRYDTADNEPVAIWIYDAEVVETAQTTCMQQMNGVYTSTTE